MLTICLAPSLPFSWFRLVENQVSLSRLSPVPAELFLDGSMPISAQSAPMTPPHLIGRVRVNSEETMQMASRMEHVHVLTHPALVNAVSTGDGEGDTVVMKVKLVVR